VSVTRRDAMLGALALVASAPCERARARPVTIGSWIRIPHGLDPAHPEPMEAGASRAGRTALPIPESAPRLAWERDMISPSPSARARPPIVAADGTIAIGTPQGLVVVDLGGAPRLATSVAPIEASPVLLPGGGWGVIGRGGRVVVIAPDGTPSARLELSSAVSVPPLVLDDGSLLIAGNDRTLRLVDAALHERWRIDLPTGGARAPMRDGDRVIVAAAEEVHVVAIRGPLEGTIERSVPLGARAISAPARADDGTAWIATHDGHLVAVAGARRVRARTAIASVFREAAPAIAGDGSVRIAAGARGLVCVGPTGQERWTAATAASLDFPVRVDSGGRTLAIDRGSTMRAFASDGRVMWELPVSQHTPSAPVIGRDGSIVAVGQHGRVMVWAPS
jgi:hypothetical protein